MGATLPAATEPWRVVVVDGSGEPSPGALALATGLTSALRVPVVVRAAGADLPPMQSETAVLFLGGPGATADAGAIRRWMESGAGMLAIAARPEAWPKEFSLADWLGAKPGGAFAGGASLSVINLFGHPILSGIERLESKQPVTTYEKLAEDVQMIVEGTVGEATTPLAWVRRRGGRRMVHVALGDAGLFRDASYQRMMANAVLWACARPIPGARPIVQRTFMPEAHPGSFAITLPEGPGICFDPVRGGINYVWDGDFVDLRPRWLTKAGEPPRIFGDVFYQEKSWHPLRAGPANGPGDFQFLGYALHDGWPEFHYRVGGRDVYEAFTATADGGLLRRFRIGAGDASLWLQLEPQSAAEVSVRGLERDGNVARFARPEGGEFTIEVRRKALHVP